MLAYWCFFGAVLFYFSTEKWLWHHTVYYERLFWVAICFAWASIKRLSAPTTAFLLVCTASFHDESFRRTRGRHRYITARVRTLPKRSPEAEGKALRVRDVILAANKLRGPTGGLKQLWDKVLGNSKHYERLLHTILMDATAEELNYMLCTVDLPEVLQYATWETEEMLGSRVRLMNTTTKAVLIDALQKKGLPFDSRRQDLVFRIMSSVKGQDMTFLKSLLDIRKEYHNLHRLVFEDMDDGPIQKRVLDHIAAEGRVCTDRKMRAVKVLSDIDDTLLSSGGVWPAGCDDMYPKGVCYPGVLAFYRELDLGLVAHSDEAEEPPQTLAAAIDSHVGNFSFGGRNQSLSRSCGLVFLSARPHVYKDYGGEHHFFTHVISPLEGSNLLHTVPSMIPGSIRESLKPVWNTIVRRQKSEAWRPVGVRKKERLEEYAQLYPECWLVFVGDNGQADLLAAEEADELLGTITGEGGGHWSTAKPSDGRMLASFIHAVQPKQAALSKHARLPLAKREQRWRQAGIRHFKTYIEAAVLAWEASLIDRAAVLCITREAVQDFIRLKSGLTEGKFEKRAKIDPENWGSWKAAREELNVGIRKVNAAFASETFEMIPELDDVTRPRGSAVGYHNLDRCPSMCVLGHS